MQISENEYIARIWTYGSGQTLVPTQAPATTTPSLTPQYSAGIARSHRPPKQPTFPSASSTASAAKPEPYLIWMAAFIAVNLLIGYGVIWTVSGNVTREQTVVLEKTAESVRVPGTTPPVAIPVPRSDDSVEAAKHLSLAVNSMSDEVAQLRDQLGQLRSQVKSMGGELNAVAELDKTIGNIVTRLDLLLHNRQLFPAANGGEKFQQAGNQTNPNKTTQNQ